MVLDEAPALPALGTHPDPNRFIQADGKVITPLYKAKRGQEVVDRQTGEMRPVRFDPDATLHIEGGGIAAFGNKSVIASARNEHDRVVLDVELDPGKKGEGGEAGVAMGTFERLEDANAVTSEARKLVAIATETDLLDRHATYVFLEKALYSLRDNDRNALDDFEKVCENHDDEMDEIRPAMMREFGGIVTLWTHRPMAILK